MTKALFRRIGDRILPLPAAEGPWMPGVLSGTAVGPLMATLAEEAPTPCAMLVSRLSVEFLRPVPMVPLEARVTVVREGGKQQILHIRLLAANKDVAAATVVRLRVHDLPTQHRRSDQFIPPLGPSFVSCVAPGSQLLTWIDSCVLRRNEGDSDTTEAWLRFNGSIVEGRALTPLMRAAMFADFGNGLAPVVDPGRFSFLNADLSLHLARLPQGEWIRLMSRTLDGGVGLGMVTTEIGDCHGSIGWAHQALLFQPR